MGNAANNLSQPHLKGNVNKATEDDRKSFGKHKRRHIRVRPLVAGDPNEELSSPRARLWRRLCPRSNP